MARRPRARRTALLAALFLVHALPFLSRPALIGGDEPHYALMAHSLAVDGDLDLEEDYRRVEAGSPAAGRKIAGWRLDRHLLDVGDLPGAHAAAANGTASAGVAASGGAIPDDSAAAAAATAGRRVFSHPLGLPLLAAPLLALAERLAPGAAPDWWLGALGLAVTFAGLLAGASLLSEEAGSAAAGDLLTFGLYFTTPLWFYSRTFFTEPYLWAALVLAVWLLRREHWLAAGACLAVALALKETALLAVVPILTATFVARTRLGRGTATSRGSSRPPGRKRGAALVLVFPLVAGALWVVKNLGVYGRPLVTFQPFQWGDPLAGALGLLVDPVHGLLPFAPLAALAAAGWAVGLWSGGAAPYEESVGHPGATPGSGAHRRAALWWALAIFLLWFAVAAAWTDWRGGTCYGPRLLVPVLPALALPLAALWRRWGERPAFRGLLTVLLVAGFTVQWCAATDPFHAFWSMPLPDLLTARPAWTAGGAILGAVAVAVLMARTRRRALVREPL